MLSRLLIFLTFVVLGIHPLYGRDKTDIVYFVNGDVIHCEIKKLERGKLTVKSIGFGTINIEWDKIAHIESEHPYQLELRSGIRYLGPVAPGEESGKIEVQTLAGTNRLDQARIVSIESVEESFFERLDGSIDIGYDFTVASSATGWSLNADTAYVGENYDAKIVVDSLYKTQEGADPVNRQNLEVSYSRHFRDRWFSVGLGQIQKNDNQALEFRGLVGGGIGRRLVQTTRTRFFLLGGAAFSNEKFTDTDFLKNVEMAGGVVFDTFRFNSPEIQITANALVLPSVTQTGRVRIQADAKLRLELFKDLFWQLSFFESFDSDPPSALSSRNDFGITTSFGWSF